MRNFCLAFLCLSLSACATTAPVSSETPKKDKLTAKSLVPGECGLFGWTADQARLFVFYADKKTARYADPDGPVDLFAETSFPAVSYKDPSGGLLELRLGQGEAMDGGTRYPKARIVTQTDEGWERLRPVAIVKSCQPR